MRKNKITTATYKQNGRFCDVEGPAPPCHVRRTKAAILREATIEVKVCPPTGNRCYQERGLRLNREVRLEKRAFGLMKDMFLNLERKSGHETDRGRHKNSNLTLCVSKLNDKARSSVNDLQFKYAPSK